MKKKEETHTLLKMSIHYAKAENPAVQPGIVSRACTLFTSRLQKNYEKTMN